MDLITKYEQELQQLESDDTTGFCDWDAGEHLGKVKMLRRVISDLKKFQEDYDRQLWNSDTISL
jgi:hypothetical protein